MRKIQNLVDNLMMFSTNINFQRVKDPIECLPSSVLIIKINKKFK